MSVFKSSVLVVRGSLFLVSLVTVLAGSPLRAQQAQIQAPTIAAPTAVAAPAPAASPLFVQNDANAPTIANARASNAAAMNEGGNHTIVVSTLVLVLGVIILVLLID